MILPKQRKQKGKAACGLDEGSWRTKYQLNEGSQMTDTCIAACCTLLSEMIQSVSSTCSKLINVLYVHTERVQGVRKGY